MEDEEFEVLYAILTSPSISVNQLYARLKGKVSKVRLIRLIRRLRKLGLIRAVKDPKHKQRILLFLKDDVQDLARNFLVKTCSAAKNNIAGEVDRLTCVYVKVASKIRDPVVLDFLKKLVLKQIDTLLSSVL